MSSKGGWSVSNDGADFSHREKVANHYKASSVNKTRFKLVSFLHIALAILMVFRLTVSFCVMFGVRPPSALQRMRFPKAEAWEHVWLCSIISTIFGLIALRRNKTFLMQQYLIGTVVFGVGSVLYALYDMSDDVMKYLNTKESTKLFLGYPIVILWSMFLVICLQVHMFGVYFAWNLLKAWTAATSKKRN